MKQKKVYLLSILMLMIPLTAELWSSSSPLVMKYQGEYYFPAFQHYHPSEFGISDLAIVTHEAYETLPAEWKFWAFNRWGPDDIDKSMIIFPGKPGSTHLMGTDMLGKDIFAIILYGLRVAYLYSIGICVVTLAIGFFIGGFLGYYGGAADLISQRLVEIFSLIPSFFLILMALSMFNSSIILLVVINCILGWMGISQMARVETLKVRKFTFIEAATALGEKRFLIFMKHILPHTLLPILTMLPFLFMGHIVGLTVLDYLGLGVSSEFPSIGALISQGQKQLDNFWWIIFFPSAVLTIILLAWVYIGEELRSRANFN